MGAKQTPGPWVVDYGEALNVRAPHGGIVAQLHHLKGRHGMGGRLPDGEAVANAHLIAAAPELLAVARELVRQFGRVSPIGTGGLYELIQDANAAIAKATGEQA